jgi:hypothetical protein
LSGAESRDKNMPHKKIRPPARRRAQEEIMTVVDPRLAGKPVPRISRETMERGHTARASAKGSDLAFLDQRLPAYEREIINTVGMGITENPALRPDVKAGAKGISITYVRAAPAPPCDLGSVHGRWQVFWLEGDDERTLDLDEGDLCNVPDRHLSRLPQRFQPSGRAVNCHRWRAGRRQGRLAPVGRRQSPQERAVGRRRQ